MNSVADHLDALTATLTAFDTFEALLDHCRASGWRPHLVGDKGVALACALHLHGVTGVQLR